MAIPTREECLELMERLAMPAHIRRHSEAVARVALLLARELVGRGAALDLALIESAALLHDVGKARGLETHVDHAKLGAEMLDQLGCAELAPIVRTHAGLDSFERGEPVTPALLVNYADKRVMHDAVVSLAVRFDDLAARYAHGDDARAFLERLRERYCRLETTIFETLTIGPDDVR
jgi:putative nucleotidyltransferase with HDIG domain